MTRRQGWTRAGRARPLIAGLISGAVMALSGCDNWQEQPPGPAARGAVEELAASAAAPRPNLLLILADDLGYSDIGAFGSEIDTPNIDALAGDGLVFSQFYTSPMCSPTRAMLLSGMDNHRAGMGTLHEKIADNQRGQPGYEGHLTERVAALPALLRAGGYRTYMTGKWHLGEDEAHSPAAAGFDKSFALVESGAGHFADMQSLSDPRPALYREDGKPVERLPEDFYSTRFYTDRLLEYIEQDRAGGRPFFAYLAYTAPHFPLQAPAESIAKYAGKYDAGYEVLHETRIERLKELGLVPAHAEPFPPLETQRGWAELSATEKKVSARRMEIYAAMIDEMDRHIGKVIDYLKEIGEYENTLIFFMSDNGAEGHWLHQGLQPLEEYREQCCDLSYENMGAPGSYVMLGPNWARAASGPYRLFKGFTSEGGIRVPALVHFPAGFTGSAKVHQGLTAMDVMPTFLEVAGIEHPAPRFEGRDVLPLQGRSMAALMNGSKEPVHGEVFSLGWEFLGKRAWRSGDWKLVWQPEQPGWEPWPEEIRTGEWQLYNLADDPGERYDLSAEYPTKRDQMIALWEEYARSHGVIHPDRVSGY